MILVGILEFSMLFRDYLSVSSSVRVGTRVAASGANSGQAICPSPLPTDVTGCTGANTPQLAVSAANAIQMAGSAMSQDMIDEIWIYRSNTSGFAANSYYVSSTTPNTATGATTQDAMIAAGCTSACVKYRWSDANNRFQYAGGTWDSTKINACIKDSRGQGPDAVGVYMKASHPMLTNMFGSTITLQDRSVMVFEPLPSGACAPLAHA
jgi:hypothetical protein